MSNQDFEDEVIEGLIHAAEKGFKPKRGNNLGNHYIVIPGWGFNLHLQFPDPNITQHSIVGFFDDTSGG